MEGHTIAPAIERFSEGRHVMFLWFGFARQVRTGIVSQQNLPGLASLGGDEGLGEVSIGSASGNTSDCRKVDRRFSLFVEKLPRCAELVRGCE